MASNFDLLPSDMQQRLADVTEDFLRKQEAFHNMSNEAPLQQNIITIEFQAAANDVTRVSNECVKALGEIV